MDYLEGLNNMQREAVLATEGPLLVLAGAGSGKTRVLTHRIAYLIEEKGVRPSSILAITFTNKAAKEMKERIKRLLENGVESMWVGTFHSMCVRILRRNIEEIGYNTNFVIYDVADQKTLIKDCIKEINLDEKLYDVKSILAFIGSQKNIMVGPEQYLKENYTNFRERQKGEVYSLYQKKLKENNALDFGDLIGKTIELFRNNPEVLEYYQEKFKYVLVDEYQDTNGAQYELVRSLAHKHKNICVVGDDDQSIYGWRGADITNILGFEKDYDNAKVIKLEQNYRSTKTILDAANTVIENNYGRKSKRLWTSNEEGTKIKAYRADNEHGEAKYICDNIKLVATRENMRYSDFAILYRTNAQSRVLEETLIRYNIPYKIVGGLKFYDRKEIKDIISYLRLIQNPVDNISLKRIINIPKRGIGLRTMEKVEQYSIEKGESIYSAIFDADKIPGLSQRAIVKLKSFASMIGKFIAMKEMLGVRELIDNVIDDIQYVKNLEKEGTVEARTRIENIREFISVAIDYENRSEEKSIEEFLSNISLLSDLDKTDEGEVETVTLMTLHSAKGLEFPVVFLSGMEERIFPTARALTSDEDLEEERRLCYVGITRAKKLLYLTHTEIRMLYGRTTCSDVSRFIREIPDKLLDSYIKPNKMENAMRMHMKKVDKMFKYAPKTTPKIVENNSDEIKSGMKVRHKLWGIGTVVQIKGEGKDAEATIVFESQGIKKLMIAYAPVEIV